MLLSFHNYELHESIFCIKYLASDMLLQKQKTDEYTKLGENVISNPCTLFTYNTNQTFPQL